MVPPRLGLHVEIRGAVPYLFRCPPCVSMSKDDAELRCTHCGERIVAKNYKRAEHRYSQHVKDEHDKRHKVRHERRSD